MVFAFFPRTHHSQQPFAFRTTEAFSSTQLVAQRGACWAVSAESPTLCLSGPFKVSQAGRPKIRLGCNSVDVLTPNFPLLLLLVRWGNNGERTSIIPLHVVTPMPFNPAQNKHRGHIGLQSQWAICASSPAISSPHRGSSATVRN